MSMPPLINKIGDNTRVYVYRIFLAETIWSFRYVNNIRYIL